MISWDSVNLILIQKMKRIIFLWLLITSCLFDVASQQTVVIQQSSKSSLIENSAEFLINGISSKEDIGGVEAEVASKMKSRFQGEEVHVCFVRLKNFNTFPVTVLYQAGKDKIVGSVVLQVGETKTKDIGYVTTGYGGAISPSMFSVSTITRKL